MVVIKWPKTFQSWVRHPVIRWMAATLDGIVEGPRGQLGARWDHRQNSLAAADAKLVEEAFKLRLAEFLQSEPAEAPAVSGIAATQATTPKQLADEGVARKGSEQKRWGRAKFSFHIARARPCKSPVRAQTMLMVLTQRPRLIVTSLDVCH
jgi:hypothetical protein